MSGEAESPGRSFKEVGAQLRNWGRWGPDDGRGTLNFVSPDKLVAAARLVRRGVVFDLGAELGSHGPQTGALGNRINPIHLMSQTPADFRTMAGGLGGADDFVFMPLQAATHWDGLAHIYYDGQMYNGASTDSITTLGGSADLAITALARDVVGRGVLIDVARLKGVSSLERGEMITPEDIEAAEQAQGVKVGSGDILLLRTGWWQRFVNGSAAEYLAGEPGIGLACCAWLHERQVAALACDNWGIEVKPSPEDDGVALLVHPVLLRDMGLTLGEMFDLETLADDCERDGIWDFFFTAPALKITAAVGTPINPLAIK